MLKDRLAATLGLTGWTQRALALRLDLEESRLSRFLKGSEPRGSQYAKIMADLDAIDAEFTAVAS